MGRRVAWTLLLATLGIAVTTAPAAAQSGTSGTSTAQSTSTTQTSSSSATPETRPATPTFFGDTGLWFAPTAEILPSNSIAISGYRRGTNYFQGLTNVGDFAGTVGVGLMDRVELFGSFLFDTRIDRELKPIFVNNSEYGSFLAAYPRVNRSWTGNNVGDLYVGAKINLWSQFRQQPAAIALRGVVKVPTGDERSEEHTSELQSPC